MFGNRPGWIIAGIILLLECAGVFYALSFDNYSPPSELTTPTSLAAINLPAAPPGIAPPAGTADALSLYRSAIAEYLSRAAEIEAMIRDSDRSGLSKLNALDQIMAAGSAKGDTLFADQLDQLVSYGQPDQLNALARLGFATYRLGVLQGRRPSDRARSLEYYRAVFVLGQRLAKEKITWYEYDAGVGLSSEAGAALQAELARLPERAADAAALAAFLEMQRKTYEANRELFTALHSPAEQLIAKHAGDVFEFATRSSETMWRIEATLKLGRMRYNVGVPPVPGNQRQAIRLLRKLKDSPEPAVRKAAELAAALTVEEFRTLR